MLEYKPSLGFVETAGLVIAIQVADAMAKAAEVEIIRAHKVDGLRICVICKGDVAACQAAVETGAMLAKSMNGLLYYNIIPSPAEEVDDMLGLLEQLKERKAAKKAERLARLAMARGSAAPGEEQPGQRSDAPSEHGQSEHGHSEHGNKPKGKK